MSAREPTSSTSIARERQLTPVVAVLFVACLVTGVLLLFCTALPALLSKTSAAYFAWLLAAMSWSYLVGSDLHYLFFHQKTSVGMVPPALASLAPVSLLALAVLNLHGILRAALLIVCGLSALTALVFAIAFLVLRRAYAHAPAPERNAAIIVLGGAVKQGQPSPTLELRLQRASELYHASPQRLFVLTGGPIANDARCEADYMNDYLVGSGVDPHNLFLERAACNTAQNVRNSIEMLEEKGSSHQLCVLTSDYHIFRALREGRKHGVSLVPIACPTSKSSRLQQWSREVLTLLFFP